MKTLAPFLQCTLKSELIFRGELMMKERIVLTPQYLGKFQCIGPKCEDNCCYGWKVIIDEKMHKKYKKVSDIELKTLISKNITRNRSNPSIENYSKIKMNSEGNCPFLCEDKLCDMQKKLGVGYLSKVCMTYPRISNVLNGFYEKSLTFSCPEAVRVALLNPKLMEFDEFEENIEVQNIIMKEINTTNIKYSNKIQKHFWDLRVFTITLLQNRNYELWERLIVLGLFFQKVQSFIGEQYLIEIPNLLERYNKSIEDGSIRNGLENIPTNMAIQMQLMKELNDERLSRGINLNSMPYVQCMSEFLEGIQYTSEATVEEVVDRYKEAYEKYYLPFMQEHEFILENFLVSHVFTDMFPIISKEGVFEDYVKLIVHYGIIKMMLIGMSAYHKKLDEDMIVRLIYSFSRAIDSSNTFLVRIFKLLNDKGFNTMPYMAILIKN